MTLEVLWCTELVRSHCKLTGNQTLRSEATTTTSDLVWNIIWRHSLNTQELSLHSIHPLPKETSNLWLTKCLRFNHSTSTRTKFLQFLDAIIMTKIIAKLATNLGTLRGTLTLFSRTLKSKSLASTCQIPWLLIPMTKRWETIKLTLMWSHPTLSKNLLILRMTKVSRFSKVLLKWSSKLSMNLKMMSKDICLIKVSSLLRLMINEEVDRFYVVSSVW